MRLIILTLALALVVIAASVVYLAIQAPESPLHSEIKRDTEVLLASLSDPKARQNLRAQAESRADFFGDLGDGLPSRWASLTWRPVLVASMVRGSLALSALPLLGAILMVGILAGLLRRHLLTENFGYHSTTFSYAGKLILVGTLAGYVWTGLSPIGPPIWCLYLFAVGAAGGLGAYFGNLPPRL